MPTETTNLFLLEDLEDVGRTSALAASDLDALRAVADWIKTFVALPNKDLGRSGPVCPFVPEALERKTLWLAAEQVADRSVAEVVELITEYQRVFLAAQPPEDDENHKAIVVVFTDLSADRAQKLFANVQEEIAVASYVNEGFEMGGFYRGKEATAVYNASFRPFTSPVPFFLIRQAVVNDWKFFLDNEDWLPLWAERYGGSGALALAGELRRLPWRASPTAAD
jgi:Domain of unknown function (DUF6875)